MTRKHPLILLALLLLVTAALVNTASVTASAPAATPQSFPHSNPLVIPAAAFSDDGYNPSSHMFWFSAGYMEGTSAGYGCVKAPAYLPQGAKITDVWASVIDNDTTYNISINLNRVNNYSGLTEILASLNSSGASASIVTPYDSTITNPWVGDYNYSYYVTTCLQSQNTKLYSVRIWFEGPYFTYLPAIQR